MGIVLDIQKCSYHDGPGIRTTVFLKGCQLRCAWCHNPESFLIEPQLQYISEKCIGCKACAKVCPSGVHSFQDSIHTVDFSKCNLSRGCVEVCPTGALAILGTEMTAEEVMYQVLQDKAYYEESGGGITISGGEPTLQPDFLIELLTLAKKNNLHTCLETNGYIAPNVLKRILPLVDLYLFDYKITDSALLKEYTGAQGSLWTSTLKLINEWGIPVILRMPIIPGINDNKEHFDMAKSIKKEYSVIQSIEIMPYHSIGSSKWSQTGLTYSLDRIKEPTKDQVSLWLSFIAE